DGIRDFHVTGVQTCALPISAFAGVRKTVDATEAEFQRLSTGIRRMSREIPVAATELAGIAESAGQLGIQNKHILKFTRVMADLEIGRASLGKECRIRCWRAQ